MKHLDLLGRLEDRLFVFGPNPKPTAPKPPPAPIPTPRPGPASDGAEVLALMNAERAKLGIAPLARSQTLEALATAWSAAMAGGFGLTHGDFAGRLVAWHQEPEAEDIAAGYSSARAVVAGWMDSPGHRRNILDPLATRAGAGSAADGSGRIWWTADFARSA